MKKSKLVSSSNLLQNQNLIASVSYFHFFAYKYRQSQIWFLPISSSRSFLHEGISSFWNFSKLKEGTRMDYIFSNEYRLFWSLNEMCMIFYIKYINLDIFNLYTTIHIKIFINHIKRHVFKFHICETICQMDIYSWNDSQFYFAHFPRNCPVSCRFYR